MVVCRWFGLAVGMGMLSLLLGDESMIHPSSAAQLRVMTYNIEGGGANPHHLLALIMQHRPDLLILQELRHVGQVQWLAKRLRLPHQRFVSYHGRDGGVAMLSRWPLGPAQVLSFRHSRQGKVALAAPVYGPTATFWACSVHLDAPREHEFGHSIWQQAAFLWSEVFAATRRYRQVQELRAWLRQLSGDEWVIGGDFNTVPLSRVDRYLSQDFSDVLRHHPWRYLTGTYWALPQVPVKPRIDFVYHSPRLQVVEARVIQQKVSDHFPILAVFTPAPPREIPC
jgi:endonuclease/exonuclease/phosphatase (EEP) superfamily protein YafD